MIQKLCLFNLCSIQLGLRVNMMNGQRKFKMILRLELWPEINGKALHFRVKQSITEMENGRNWLGWKKKNEVLWKKQNKTRPGRFSELSVWFEPAPSAAAKITGRIFGRVSCMPGACHILFFVLVDRKISSPYDEELQIMSPRTTCGDHWVWHGQGGVTPAFKYSKSFHGDVSVRCSGKQCTVFG